MKESYHICFTSHGEVMFRDSEDHGMFINLMALRAFDTGTELLADVEQADERSISQMLNNEYGRNFSRNRLQDMDVCRLIDRQLAPRFGASSAYGLTENQKQRLARQLLYEYRLPDAQIRRCLVLP